jgi:hypothetical protein
VSQDQSSALSQVVSAAKILNVRLVESQSATKIRTPEDAPGEALLRVDHGGRVFGLPDKDGVLGVHTMVHVHVSESEKSEDLVSIRAVFEILYQLPEGLAVGNDELEAFARSNGVFNAWPYFREFVQSMATRMGLPPILLPLFRLRAPDAGAARELGPGHG